MPEDTPPLLVISKFPPFGVFFWVKIPTFLPKISKKNSAAELLLVIKLHIVMDRVPETWVSGFGSAVLEKWVFKKAS